MIATMIHANTSTLSRVPLTDEEMSTLLGYISKSNPHFLALAQSRSACEGTERSQLKSILFEMIKEYYQLSIAESESKSSKFQQYLQQIQAIEKQEKADADKLLEEQLLSQ